MKGYRSDSPVAGSLVSRTNHAPERRMMPQEDDLKGGGKRAKVPRRRPLEIWDHTRQLQDSR